MDVVCLHGRLTPLRFHQPHEVVGYHYSAIGTVCVNLSYLYHLSFLVNYVCPRSYNLVIMSFRFGVGGWVILKRKDGRGGLPHVLSLLLRFLRVLRVLRKLEST